MSRGATSMRAEMGLIGAGALLLTVAQPPFELVLPAFLCHVPGALLILRSSTRARHAAGSKELLRTGFLYGAVTHAVLLHWLAYALWSHRPVALLLFPLAAMAFGGFYALLFHLVGRVVQDAPARLLLALPAGMTALEWVAANAGGLALPWFPTALTVASSPTLVQAADLVGPEGLGFLIVLVNAALALAWAGRQRPRTALARVAAAGALVILLATYGAVRVATLPLERGATVAVIQPNATAQEKWSPDAQDDLVTRTVELARETLTATEASFVVLPETAVPAALTSRPDWAARLHRLALRSGATLVVGAVDTEPSDDGAGTRRYNAAFAFPTRGRSPEALYRKRQLVPMIETGRLGPLDAVRAGSFAAGSVGSIGVAPVGRYGTLVCFEITFAAMARELRRGGADFLVTLSNDAWLGRTLGPHQHFAHARLRAVEARTSVIRAANSGISGIVDPLGRVSARTPLFIETYAEGAIYRSDAVPPALLIADWVGPLALALLGGLWAMAVAGRRGARSKGGTRSTGRGAWRPAPGPQPSRRSKACRAETICGSA